MDNATLSFLTQQLLYQVPLVLVCVVGIVLPVIFWRRCPVPSALTLIAAAVLLVTTLAAVTAQTYLFHARLAQGGSIETYGRMSSLIGAVSSVMRGLSIGALLAAVFVGRKR